MKKFTLFITFMLMVITASAQSLIGLWRWETDPGQYKYMNFKTSTLCVCSDYGEGEMQYGNYQVSYAASTSVNCTYKKSGSRLSLTYNVATFKVTLHSFEVYPEVSDATYNKLKSEFKNVVTRELKKELSHNKRTETYRIDVFSDDQLQMQLGYDLVYYWRVDDYDF